MLAKKTVKNQITLPKPVASRFAGVEYFEVTVDADAIVLRPFRPSRADAVRTQLAKLGITEEDVRDGVAWARESR